MERYDIELRDSRDIQQWPRGLLRICVGTASLSVLGMMVYSDYKELTAAEFGRGILSLIGLFAGIGIMFIVLYGILGQLAKYRIKRAGMAFFKDDQKLIYSSRETRLEIPRDKVLSIAIKERDEPKELRYLGINLSLEEIECSDEVRQVMCENEKRWGDHLVFPDYICGTADELRRLREFLTDEKVGDREHEICRGQYPSFEKADLPGVPASRTEPRSAGNGTSDQPGAHSASPTGSSGVTGGGDD